MKTIKNKSLSIVLLLSALVVSGCQNIPTSSENSFSNMCNTTSPSAISSEASLNGTPDGSLPAPNNEVIVVKQPNESTSRDDISFRVDSLDKEFYLRLSDLYDKDTNKVILYNIFALYLVEVNKDGHHDFVYSTGDGRSMSQAGTWVRIYDYQNGKELYRLDDPGEYDYEIFFEENKFSIEQRIVDAYDTKCVLELGRVVGIGTLDYSTANITTKWENFLNADSFNFNVTLAGKDRTPVALKPGEEKDTYIIEHASVDKAYCITTNIVRNSGNYDDLTTDLPVGYRLNEDYCLVQAIANNHQDNVIVSLDASNLKYLKKDTAFLEASVSGFNYKIIFEFDTLDYDPSDKTLKDVLGWSFTKDELVEFSYEFIPGGNSGQYSEESYPLMDIYVANGEEATKSAYTFLEEIVAEIDPALVERMAEPTYFNFKTNDAKYSYTKHHAFIECGDAFCLTVNSRNSYYAINNSKGYYRFRDSRTEIDVTPCQAGLQPKVLKNANSIIFDDKELTSAQQERYLKNAKYKFDIAGNEFYIYDATTMIRGMYKYSVTSTYNFSSIF